MTKSRPMGRLLCFYRTILSKWPMFGALTNILLCKYFSIHIFATLSNKFNRIKKI